MSSNVVRPRPPSADVVADDPTADSNVDNNEGDDEVKEVTSVLRKQTVAGLVEGGGGGNASGGRLGGSRNHTGAVYVLSRKRKQFQVKFLFVVVELP
jgi:hypothetical protein